MQEFKKVPACKKSIENRRLLHGVGINDADYMVSVKSNGKQYLCPAYTRWNSMLARCYGRYCQENQPTYSECSVSNEWLTFSNFRKWFEENYVEGYQLDKDLKIKGNKTYSQAGCMFVPPEINSLLNDCRARMGDFPTGVHLHKKSKKFISKIRIDGKQVYLGLFDTAELASNTYKKAKNLEIKRKCNKYPEFGKYLIKHLIN